MCLINFKKLSLSNENGSILIFTLWIVIIIAVLALGVAYTARLEVKSVSYNLDELKVHYVMRGGVYKVLSRLKEYYDIRGYDTTKSYEGLIGEEFSLGKGDYEVTEIQDEEAKININLASKQVIKQISGVTEEIADYIVGKRPFKNIESLILSGDITEEKLSDLRYNITVYGDGKINFNSCENNILDSLKGLPSLQEKSLKDKIRAEINALKYSCGGSNKIKVGLIKKSVFNGLREIKNKQDFEDITVIQTKFKNNEKVKVRKKELKAQLENILYDCCMAEADVKNKGPYCNNWAEKKSSTIKNSFFSYIVDALLDHIDVKSNNYRIIIKGKLQEIEKKVTAVGNKFEKKIKFWHSHYYNNYE